MSNIPKKIHYCWFGGKPLPEITKNYIASWKRQCPEYEIVEWNEKNFDVSYNQYTLEAFQMGKWAFVADVARLYALVNYGGIYLDTDVEVVKNFDDLLDTHAFIGFQSEKDIQTAVMASEKGNILFTELLHEYDGTHFLNSNGQYDLTTNVQRFTRTCLKYGLKQNNKHQVVRTCSFYPTEYFCPLNVSTRELKKTDNTYTIHYFDGSWLTDVEKYENKVKLKFNNVFGVRLGGLIARFVSIIKYRGVRSAIGEYILWCQKKRKK